MMYRENIIETLLRVFEKTPTQVSYALGVSYSRMNLLLCGEHPTDEEIEKLAEIFQVDKEAIEFFYKEGGITDPTRKWLAKYIITILNKVV